VVWTEPSLQQATGSKAFKMKGIIVAGGVIRVSAPLTIAVSKQMVPIYDSDAVGSLQRHFHDQPEARWRYEMNQTAGAMLTAESDGPYRNPSL
jgi:hypothetical protein